MITQISNWQSQTAEQLHTYLLASEQVPSGRGRLTHAWVAENIGMSVADAVYAAIDSVSPPTALRYNVGNGIDTTAEFWKQQASAVAVAAPALAPYLETLRDFEFTTRPRWQALGYETEPTIESVQSELDQLADQAARQAVFETLYGPEWNTHIAPVLDGDRNTATVANLVAGLRALADALEVRSGN